MVKDAIADAFLQQILLRPDEYDVIATLKGSAGLSTAVAFMDPETPPAST